MHIGKKTHVENELYYMSKIQYMLKIIHCKTNMLQKNHMLKIHSFITKKTLYKSKPLNLAWRHVFCFK